MLLPALRIEREAPGPSALGSTESSLTEWRDPSGRVCARGQVHARGAWVELPDVARYSLVTTSSLVTAVPVGRASETAVAEGFSRTALPFLLQVQGVQCLHASAILTAAGVVAMCGESGVGKSTLAAALAHFGFGVWADDAVAFECPRGRLATSVQLPFALRLSPSSLRLLASLAKRAAAGSSVPGREQPIIGLLVLQRGGDGDPRLVRLSPAEAFKAVVEHSYSFSLSQLDARRRFSENQLGLVTTVPSFRVWFTPTSRSFSALVQQVAAHVETQASASQRDERACSRDHSGVLHGGGSRSSSS